MNNEVFLFHKKRKFYFHVQQRISRLLQRFVPLNNPTRYQRKRNPTYSHLPLPLFILMLPQGFYPNLELGFSSSNSSQLNENFAHGDTGLSEHPAELRMLHLPVLQIFYKGGGGWSRCPTALLYVIYGLVLLVLTEISKLSKLRSSNIHEAGFSPYSRMNIYLYFYFISKRNIHTLLTGTIYISPFIA